jgi:hypothetical protein
MNSKSTGEIDFSFIIQKVETKKIIKKELRKK